MTIIVSDFDGTITKGDSLYNFFDKFASSEWLDVEDLWTKGKISSKECLIKEFELVKGLSEKLIEDYTKTIEIDEDFFDFIELTKKENADFIVVSDGIDYFINKILKNNNINNIKLITNHAEFINGKFTLSFPNGFVGCDNDSGTCKCKVVSDLKKTHDKIYYIGDGASDFCVSEKVDYLFAKSSLKKHCLEKNIKFKPFETFGDIAKVIEF